MANPYDAVLNGTFDQLGMPRMSPSEQLQWLQSYGQPVQVPPVAPAAPSPASTPPVMRSMAATPAYAYAPTGPSPMEDAMIAGGIKPGIPLSQQANVNHVAGRMTPGQPRGDLLSLLMGPSKNGQTGLLGLLGGPQQGGLLGMLMGGQRPASASRYTPEQLANRTAQGKAIGEANRNNPNPTYNISGENNAFMPQSVQNSVRWQTGY